MYHKVIFCCTYLKCSFAWQNRGMCSTQRSFSPSDETLNRGLVLVLPLAIDWGVKHQIIQPTECTCRTISSCRYNYLHHSMIWSSFQNDFSTQTLTRIPGFQHIALTAIPVGVRNVILNRIASIPRYIFTLILSLSCLLLRCILFHRAC